MADNVNLQQSEYDAAMEKLAVIHSEALEKIKNLSDEIKELSEIDGGFYIDKISAKISLLLETLDTGIMSATALNMEAAEEGMDSFAQMVTNVDSACSI